MSQISAIFSRRQAVCVALAKSRQCNEFQAKVFDVNHAARFDIFVLTSFNLIEKAVRIGENDADKANYSMSRSTSRFTLSNLLRTKVVRIAESGNASTRASPRPGLTENDEWQVRVNQLVQ